jgi:hypothetical protein
MKKIAEILPRLGLLFFPSFLTFFSTVNYSESMRFTLWGGDVFLLLLLIFVVPAIWKKGKRFFVPPMGIRIFILCLIACLAFQPRDSLLEGIQLFAYVYGVWLCIKAAELFGSPYKVFFFGLLLMVAILIGFGIYQAVFCSADNYLVRGIYPNYHVFSAMLVMTILYILPVLLIQRRSFHAMLTTVLVVGAYACIKSPPAMVALSLGALSQVILLAYFRLELKNSRLVLTSAAAILALAFACFMKPENIKSLAEYYNPFEPENVDMRYSRVESILDLPVMHFQISEMDIWIEDPTLFLLKVNAYKRYEDLNGKHLITQRLVERIVSTNMFLSNPSVGIGLGNYQKTKDFHYGSIEKVNTTEPFSYSTFATKLGTGGIIMIFGIAAFLAFQFFNIIRSLSNGIGSTVFLVGAFGSSVTFIVLSYQMDTMTGAILPLFMLLSTTGIKDWSNELKEFKSGH